jgi:alkanesulfonate monooxygenase SsuD/methylene tetrahydromethanopterin reductase-like flavin-dependent oxidoreductase (luciferase family)
MIRKFGSLYIGHVDLADIGFGGIPVNDRRLSDEQLATVFAKAESIARLMDRLGYETLWLGEHHFQHEGHECIPNPLLLGVHLSRLTGRLRFGCAFNVTPNWHPLRLAEDYATADILTNGRIVFGVGRGYHSREVETLGSPLIDQDANRELFEEQVEIIFKAFNEPSFSHHGRHYQIPPPVPYRGYRLGGNHAGAAAAQPSGRVLPADRQRQPARHGLHGPQRNQRHDRRGWGGGRRGRR